jgi:HD-GYP domain-containing protein (c-di-GMP phosphodiesterase class II)
VTEQKIFEGSGTHFDPSLAEVFKGISKDFEQIYAANKD